MLVLLLLLLWLLKTFCGFLSFFVQKIYMYIVVVFFAYNSSYSFMAWHSRTAFLDTHQHRLPPSSITRLCLSLSLSHSLSSSSTCIHISEINEFGPKGNFAKKKREEKNRKWFVANFCRCSNKGYMLFIGQFVIFYFYFWQFIKTFSIHFFTFQHFLRL